VNTAFWFMSGSSSVATSARPAIVPHAPLPPFDQSDAFGEVHTVLPPEQVIPSHFTDPTWIRADFNGVTLPGSYLWEGDGVRMTSGRWKGLYVPFLKGANSTPPTMIMTPMLVLYPREVQDAVLTEHAERGYDDFIFDTDPWNAPENGYVTSPAKMTEWAKRLKSWGFRTFLWHGNARSEVDQMFETLMQAGLVNFYGHGVEVDEFMTSEEYEASLHRMDHYIKGRIPIGAHFTADRERKMGYPIGFPRDTFLNDWSPFDGRVHLLLQLNGTASAGQQGASMYYARQHVNAAIGDAAWGPGAPNSRVIAFETMATEQLYGRCDENYGNLRQWELLCGTRRDARVRPVSGFGNGARRPDGTAL